ncbi:hypothetical protein MesoLjLc_75190 [Mesorhizobium sp. L-8-10]|uniref:4'-phosphopantetheinyl transferase family protein n=1 Tax=Mesorhizobium sp. L-8-10 TaxID=2744523 RepID=UPI0019297802|nr:4'-phosphopantetheinyl transferase superfamily protein [Mesorhizobium sp. L-8-10]BCH35589.1 hypothetical protein MesoLjLc_75190 [Mesorhizobium sp. L-8-10]
MTLALAGLFDADIRVAQGDPRAGWGEPLPGEAAAVARASPARRREFMAGRALARRAMAALDVTAAAIPAAEDRAPVWPSDVRGSISHCADWCVAAAARADDGYFSIGVDIEPAEPLDADLIEEICTAEERRWLTEQPVMRRDLLARMIFCAKECAYKCQYPLSGQLLDFQALSIRIDEISSGLEQFQQKCAAVLRPELRKNKELEHGRYSEKSGNALEQFQHGRAKRDTPLCPAGHLPLRGGDSLSSYGGTRFRDVDDWRCQGGQPISPLEGEMSGRTEGGATAPTSCPPSIASRAVAPEENGNAGAASAFTARFEIDAAPFRKGDELAGRITLDGGYIVAGMALKREAMGLS